MLSELLKLKIKGLVGGMIIAHHCNIFYTNILTFKNNSVNKE